MASLNIQRISKRFHEIYDSEIDVSDVKGKAENIESSFCTRALAATALMMRCNIDAKTAANSVTDGYHDLGIDAIYLDDNNRTLFIVQSKWRNEGSGSISREEMDTFVGGLKRVIGYDLAGANEKIIAKQADIDTALDGIGYRIEATFVHTGSSDINDYVMRPMTELEKATNDDASDILHFSQITFKDVYEYLASEGTNEDIKIDIILNNWGKLDKPYLMYYGMVPASVVGEWYSEYGDRLFDQNLRLYKGRTDVNDGIKRVLSTEAENFVYYNNGIKLLCKKINRNLKQSYTTECGVFTLEGVSVINGAQTTGCIGKAYMEFPEQLSNAKVLIQMIDMSEMPETLGTLITKLSNTQNRIENKDFAALDPTQEKIKRELSFSHYKYLYKNGEEITDLNVQLSFDEAIVALACLYDIEYSTIAKKNVGALSDDITKAPYKALFNPSTNSFELLNSVMIIREVEKMLQAHKAKCSGKEYASCVHGNRLIEYVILQNEKTKAGFSDSVWDISTHLSDIKNVLDMIIPEISRALSDEYSDSYPASIFKNQTKSKEIANIILTFVTGKN